MTNRERVGAALSHRQPDKVPYDVRFTCKAREAMARYLHDPAFSDKIGNCFSFLRPCAGGSQYRRVRGELWADEFGVLWDKSVDRDIGVVANRLVSLEEAGTFRLPDAGDPSRFESFAGEIAGDPEGFFVVSIGFSLFERAWTLCGMENLLAGMVVQKPAVHTLLDRITEFDLALIDRSCAYDIQMVRLGDDWGHQRGLLMGPQLWREFIKPRIGRLFERIRARGKRVMLHSCGKIDEILPDLIECGLDVFNPFQPEVMDVRAIKKRHGRQLSFYGGISTQRTLPFATVRQVKEEVKSLLEEIGKGGGYIASPAHDIPGDARPENVAAMLEVLQSQ